MTYEEAVSYKEEAEALRRKIYDEGLLKATAVVNLHHEKQDDYSEAEAIAFAIEHEWPEIYLECKVCWAEVEWGHTCIDGPITPEQLRRMRNCVPGWKWPRKAKAS